MPDDRVTHSILCVPELPYAQWRKFYILNQLYLRQRREKNIKLLDAIVLENKYTEIK